MQHGSDVPHNRRIPPHTGRLPSHPQAAPDRPAHRLPTHSTPCRRSSHPLPMMLRPRRRTRPAWARRCRRCCTRSSKRWRRAPCVASAPARSPGQGLPRHQRGRFRDALAGSRRPIEPVAGGERSAGRRSQPAFQGHRRAGDERPHRRGRACGPARLRADAPACAGRSAARRGLRHPGARAQCRPQASAGDPGRAAGAGTVCRRRRHARMPTGWRCGNWNEPWSTAASTSVASGLRGMQRRPEVAARGGVGHQIAIHREADAGELGHRVRGHQLVPPPRPWLRSTLCGAHPDAARGQHASPACVCGWAQFQLTVTSAIRGNTGASASLSSGGTVGTARGTA